MQEGYHCFRGSVVSYTGEAEAELASGEVEKGFRGSVVSYTGEADCKPLVIEADDEFQRLGG